MAKSIVGDLIGKRGIVYAPINRAGVLLLFSRLLDEFDMLVEETAADCSHIVARRRVDSGWERVNISLAYKSSELSGGSSIDGDLLICWHHDWPDCPLKAFEMKSLFENELPTNTDEESGVSQGKENHSGDSLAGIIPDDSKELLMKRGVTKQRFEKAIEQLNEKIKKISPEGT